jgi:hypothetical protein
MLTNKKKTMKEQMEKAIKLVKESGYSPLKACKITGIKIEDYNNSQNGTKVKPKEEVVKSTDEVLNETLKEVAEELPTLEEKAKEVEEKVKAQPKPKVKKYKKK